MRKAAGRSEDSEKSERKRIRCRVEDDPTEQKAHFPYDQSALAFLRIWRRE